MNNRLHLALGDSHTITVEARPWSDEQDCVVIFKDDINDSHAHALTPDEARRVASHLLTAATAIDGQVVR